MQFKNFVNYFKAGGSSVIDKLFSTAMFAFIFSNLTAAIGPTVDGIIVGIYYDIASVAAIGLTSFLLVGYRTIAATIISRGSHVIVSRLMGSGDKSGANSLFSLSIILSVSLSVLIAALSIIFAKYIAAFLGARGASASLLVPAADYLIGYCIGLPFYTATVILSPYIQIDGDYKCVSASSLVMTIVDIIADLYVVLVMHGGLLEIGLATSAAHLASFLVLLGHFIFKTSSFKLSFKNINLSKIPDILRAGAASGIVKLSNTFCGILINNLLASYAAVGAIAAYSVGNSVLKACFAFWLGSANTLMAFTSMFFGEEDKNALHDVQKIAMRKGLKLTCFSALIILIFADFFARLFLRNGDPATLSMARESVRFFALSMPFNVLIYCFQFYLIGSGRRAFANIYSFIIDFAIPVPVTLLIMLMLGYQGAWIAKPVINILLVFIAWRYINKQSGKDFNEKSLLLPKHFGFAPEQELCMDVDEMSDVMGASRLAIAFALENGFDRKHANIFSMAIEELAGNIVTHGFSDGKPHHIDIRMLAKDGGLILRFRDDCKHFDPVDKYKKELQFDDDLEGGFAIRMMMKLAKEINYIGMYGMNNLIIKV